MGSPGELGAVLVPHDQLRHRILLRSLDALRSATIHFISMGSTYWREKCVLHNILVTTPSSHLGTE